MLTWQEEDQLRQLVQGDYNPLRGTFYVSSTHNGAADTPQSGRHIGNRDQPGSPLATIKQAVSNCLAGDRIVVLPGHVETVNAAAYFTLSKNDVEIIGIGEGLRKPKLTFATSTAAQIIVSGFGCKLKNLTLNCGLDAIVIALSVTGTDFVCEDCNIIHTTGQFAKVISLNAAHRAVIRNLTAYQTDAGCTSAIDIIGSAVGVLIENCWLHGDYAAANIQNSASAVHVNIRDNDLDNLNAIDVNIDLVGTTTGQISRNKCRIATDVQVTWIDAGDCAMYENYGVNNDTETGKLIGTVSV